MNEIATAFMSFFLMLFILAQLKIINHYRRMKERKSMNLSEVGCCTFLDPILLCQGLGGCAGKTEQEIKTSRKEYKKLKEHERSQEERSPEEIEEEYEREMERIEKKKGKEQELRICPECNNPIERGADYCKNCGYKRKVVLSI